MCVFDEGFLVTGFEGHVTRGPHSSHLLFPVAPPVLLGQADDDVALGVHVILPFL